MDTLSQLREAAHAIIAVLGAAAALVAFVVLGLDLFGVHGLDAQGSLAALAIGGAITALSKWIDSANNAKVIASANTIPQIINPGNVVPGIPAPTPGLNTVQPIAPAQVTSP